MAAASEVNGGTDDDSSIWRDEGVGPQEVDHLPSRVSGGRGMQTTTKLTCHSDYRSLAPISSDVRNQSQTLSHPLRIHMCKVAF